jgi:hypothetical protein
LKIEHAEVVVVLSVKKRMVKGKVGSTPPGLGTTAFHSYPKRLVLSSTRSARKISGSGLHKSPNAFSSLFLCSRACRLSNQEGMAAFGWMFMAA